MINLVDHFFIIGIVAYRSRELALLVPVLIAWGHIAAIRLKDGRRWRCLASLCRAGRLHSFHLVLRLRHLGLVQVADERQGHFVAFLLIEFGLHLAIVLLFSALFQLSLLFRQLAFGLESQREINRCYLLLS